MYEINIQLAKFLALFLFFGTTISVFISVFLERTGMSKTTAFITSYVLGAAIVALAVFVVWKRRRNAQPENTKNYELGAKIIIFGNLVFFFAAILPMLLSEPVLGGISVMLGGIVSLIAWLIGWWFIARLRF
jgi:hypothetical protein